MTEVAALRALDKLHDEISGMTGVRFSAKRVQVSGRVGSEDLCEKYRSIKKYLEGVLWLIERIPVVGKKIADAVRFIMAVADSACGM
jgi:hypothetical protein